MWNGHRIILSGMIEIAILPVDVKGMRAKLLDMDGSAAIFSAYEDGAAKDWAFSTHFVPKSQVANHGGSSHLFSGPNHALFGRFWGKWLYIHNDKIVGHVDNTKSGTGVSGVAYNNMGVVLRHVVGV